MFCKRHDLKILFLNIKPETSVAKAAEVFFV